MKERPVRALLIVAAFSFCAQLYMTGFFAFGEVIPATIDTNIGNYKDAAFQWPPQGRFNPTYYLGFGNPPVNFDPVTVLANLPAWLFFTLSFPLFATVALVGLYVLLREMGFSTPVSLFAAVAYSWHGDVLSSIPPGHFSTPALWAVFPFALYAVLRNFRTGSWLALAWAGALCGLMVTLYPDRGALCSGVIAIFYGYQAWSQKGDARACARVIASLMLVAAIAGVVARPALTAIHQTHIEGIKVPEDVGGDQKWHWATQWSFAWSEALAYVAPGVLGWSTQHAEGPYWGDIGRSHDWKFNQQGFRNFMLSTLSIGTIPSLLACIGVVFFLRQGFTVSTAAPSNFSRSLLPVFLGVLVFYFLLALGKNGFLYAIFYKLPYMDTWRNPLKFMVPVNLCLFVFAARGAEVVLEMIPLPGKCAVLDEWPARFLRWVGLLLGSLWVASYVFMVWLGAYMAIQFYTQDEIARILDTLHDSLLVAGLASGITYFSLRLARRAELEVRQMEIMNPLLRKAAEFLFHPMNRHKAFLLVIGMVAVLQMAWVQSHYITLVNLKSLTQKNPAYDILKNQGDEQPFRIKINFGDPYLQHLLTTIFPYFGIQTLDIPAISRMPLDYDLFFKALEKSPDRMFFLSGVRYCLTAISQMDGLARDQTLSPYFGKVITFNLIDVPRPTHALVEFKNWMPKAACIPRLEALSSPSLVLERLADRQWNPLESILVYEGDIKKIALPEKRAANYSGAPRIMIKEYTQTRIEVAVENSPAGFLLITDRFDPNWKACVNGKPVEIFRANHIQRGLPIPAGNVQVVMDYKTSDNGILYSLMVWGGLALWSLAHCIVCEADLNRTRAVRQADSLVSQTS